METIEGAIKSIRKDRKALSLESGEWFNSFKEISTDFGAGNLVRIEFSLKEVDDKVFRNIKSLVKTIKPANILKSDEVTKIKAPDTLVNTLIMQSIIYSKDKNLDLNTATDEVIKSYKKIIGSL